MGERHLPRQPDERNRSPEGDAETQKNRPRSSLRVVVPLDGSVLSEQALDVGKSLAELLDSTVELVHVVEPTLASTASAPNPHRQAEDYLHLVARSFPADFPVHIHVLQGNPVEELLHYLQDASNTIVAMSTHGRSGLQRFLFGSVADKVIRGVTIPVAVVRDTKHFTPSIRNLLVPLDGSEHAASALPVAMSLAKGDRTLSVIRVVDASHMHENLAIKYGSIFSDSDLLDEITMDAEHDARGSLEEIAMRLRAAGCHTTWEVRVGRPSDEIIRAAETTGTDLIVMATHGLGGVRRWAFGSVTDEVLHQSHVPVLVIPPHCSWAMPGMEPAIQ